MERNNRPVSREKNVTEGTAHVGRRENGAAPKGQAPTSGPARQGQGQERGSASNLAGAAAVVGILGLLSKGKNGKGSSLKTLLIIGVIVIVVLFLLRSGALSGLLGGELPDDGGSLNPGLTDTTNSGNNNSSGVTPGGSNNGTAADSTVSNAARDRYTVLKGNGQDTVTLMVYMCGTDLESNGGFATSDLTEMASAKLSDKVNVLVYTGGCKKWKNNVVKADRNQIFRVQNGGLAELWSNNKLQPMTDPATLASFIQWAKQNAPADRYGLIFWDHGGGSVSGYGYDEVNQRSGSMTLDGIASALKNGGCQFDFVGFDACLMATLETALVVEPYADYLIASEETEPGCGWYYTNWLTKLSNNTSMSTVDLGKTIADDFVSVCGQVAARQQATLSLIDLAELHGTLPASFRDFAVATNESVRSDDYQSVSTARANTKEFAQSSHIDQVDLIHLANNMDTPESRALAEVLRSAVKYNATSSNIKNAYGVSIYFPYGSKASNVNRMAAIYDKVGMDDNYTSCIKSFASMEVAGQTVAGGSSGQMDSLFGALLGGGSASSSGSLGGDMVGQLLGALLTGSGRSLANVGLTQEDAAFLDRSLLEQSAAYLTEKQFDASALRWTEKDGQQVLVLTEDQWDLVQDVELNVFVRDGDGYVDLGLDNVFDLNEDGDLIGAYDGTWLAVNGQIVSYTMTETTGTQDDYKILGRIPARLNGRLVDLVVCFTSAAPDGEILGAAIRYDGETETETQARGLLELQNGDVIDFLCDYYDKDRNLDGEYELGDPLTVNGPLVLSNVRMDNDETIVSYRLTDIYHNHFWTPSI